MNHARLLMAVIAFAVLARLATAAYLGDIAAPVSGAHDQISYDTLAMRVLDGYGFSFGTDWYPFTKAGEPTSHWSFPYTLYLAGVYAVTGHHPLAARLVQALFSGVSVWLLYRMGRRLFDARVGLAAAAAFAVYAYWIFFNAALMTQTFYVTFLLAALVLALEMRDGATARDWALLGAALGLGALFRQTLLLFAPVLVLWLLWQQRKAGVAARRAIAGAALSVALVATLILPFTVRNYLVYGEFLLLNSNGGYWFYASNHPSHGTDFNPNAAPPVPESVRGMNEAAADRALFREGLNNIVADPRRFALLTLDRVGEYFWIAPSEESTPISNAARLMSFALYLPFMLAGLWLGRGRWLACLPLFLYIAFDTVLHLTTWAAPRYRLPSDLLLMVFAGVALVWLAERAGLRTARRATELS